MLNEYISTLRGKTVGFIGIGVSNLPILKRFLSDGISCTVRDKKDQSSHPDYASLSEHGTRFISGEDYLNGIKEDVLFLSPAVRPDLPELVEAQRNGTFLTSEMQEFFRMCPCKIIGITGSDGKTTTTTLTAKLLEAAGKTVHLGGNIGKNLFMELDNILPEDYAVVELSSFQLFKLHQSPDIAVITNLAPNHLDWHKNMEEYAQAKQNIFAYQGKDGILVLNADDAYAASCEEKARGSIRWISGKTILENGLWFNDEGIHRGKDLLLADSDILIVGRHNRYNYAEAISAVQGIVPDDVIAGVAKTFPGVEHRIELVRELNGVKYYNSSIDSSPSRTTACLNSFRQKVIVISGGYDKHIPYDPLGPLFREKVKFAVLCGATTERIAEVLDRAGFTDYIKEQDFAKAVQLASSKAQPGDCVVLTPASASFDMFKNFAERGQTFKRLVNEL